MSNAQSAPFKVDDDEDIARIVFSPSMIEDGAVSPSAFFLRDLRKPEDYVSVFRYKYMVPTFENVSEILHAPKENIIYGYALLKSGKCRNISYKDIIIDVLSHSSPSNPFHAGIHFSRSGAPIKGSCIDPDYLIITRMLANNSTLYTF